jgi:hypothetical protein
MSNDFFSKKKNNQDCEELIIKYRNAFNAAINDVDQNAKTSIKNSYCLNKIYDLFIDFIIDSNRLLKK